MDRGLKAFYQKENNVLEAIMDRVHAGDQVEYLFDGEFSLTDVQGLTRFVKLDDLLKDIEGENMSLIRKLWDKVPLWVKLAGAAAAAYSFLTSGTLQSDHEEYRLNNPKVVEAVKLEPGDINNRPAHIAFGDLEGDQDQLLPTSDGGDYALRITQGPDIFTLYTPRPEFFGRRLRYNDKKDKRHLPFFDREIYTLSAGVFPNEITFELLSEEDNVAGLDIDVFVDGENIKSYGITSENIKKPHYEIMLASWKYSFKRALPPISTGSGIHELTFEVMDNEGIVSIHRIPLQGENTLNNWFVSDTMIFPNIIYRGTADDNSTTNEKLEEANNQLSLLNAYPFLTERKFPRDPSKKLQIVWFKAEDLQPAGNTEADYRPKNLHFQIDIPTLNHSVYGMNPIPKLDDKKKKEGYETDFFADLNLPVNTPEGVYDMYIRVNNGSGTNTVTRKIGVTKNNKGVPIVFDPYHKWQVRQFKLDNLEHILGVKDAQETVFVSDLRNGPEYGTFVNIGGENYKVIASRLETDETRKQFGFAEFEIGGTKLRLEGNQVGDLTIGSKHYSVQVVDPYVDINPFLSTGPVDSIGLRIQYKGRVIDAPTTHTDEQENKKTEPQAPSEKDQGKQGNLQYPDFETWLKEEHPGIKEDNIKKQRPKKERLPLLPIEQDNLRQKMSYADSGNPYSL